MTAVFTWMNARKGSHCQLSEMFNTSFQCRQFNVGHNENVGQRHCGLAPNARNVVVTPLSNVFTTDVCQI